MSRNDLPAFALVLMIGTIATSQARADTTPRIEVVPANEVKWTPLNPLRGDLSPKAGTLWGDRAGGGASGFLVRFKKGFSSPPHIHNVTYRGVVIRGLVHNDDPDAAKMWMPTGSFWTQPAGEVHITAAEGDDNLAYIEIGDGPYLVRPAKQSFDNGERPINVDVSNIVWVDPRNAPASGDGAKIAYLWGEPKDGEQNGSLIKLPTGFRGEMRSSGESLRAVVIKGQTSHQTPGAAGPNTLEPGSYFGSQGDEVHQVSCDAKVECVIYARTISELSIAQSQ